MVPEPSELVAAIEERDTPRIDSAYVTHDNEVRF